MLRYSFVSVVNTLLGQATLAALFGFAHWSAYRSAFVATIAASVPAFLLYRYWVWRADDSGALARDIIRFVAVMAVTLVVSTYAAGAAESVSRGVTTSRMVQTTLVMGGSMVALLLVWIVRFFLFETVVFGSGAANLSESRPL